MALKIFHKLNLLAFYFEVILNIEFKEELQSLHKALCPHHLALLDMNILNILYNLNTFI